MPEPRLVQAGTRLRAIPFSGEGDSARYRKSRYRRGPQQLVHAREIAIVRAALALAGQGSAGRHGQARAGSSDAIASALDVPCGYGRLLEVLRASGIRSVGADLSASQARLAREVAPAIAGNLLAGLPFPDASFDLVMSVRLLHHLRHPDDRAAAIRELARVSRRHVLLSYYAEVPIWSVHRRLMERLKLRKPRIAVVSEVDIARDCEAASLRPVARWRVLPGIHAHRFGLFRRS